jgi:hypothetical protein
MALFDERPKIEKNTFTAQDAGTVFRNAAEAIDKGSLPADITDIVLQVAQLLLQVGKTFAADR